MSKDPAFLFYTSDFLTGTILMSNEQVGIYMRLLCIQHQHGGLIDKVSFNSIVGNNDIVRQKFIECDDGFYNVRLMNEMAKRINKSNTMSANARIRWEKVKQMQCKSNAIAMQTDNDNISSLNSSFLSKDIKPININLDIIYNVDIIYKYWCSKDNLPHHKILTQDMIKTLKYQLETYPVEELTAAIDNYSAVLNDMWCYYKHIHTLEAFFRKGVQKESPFKKFLNEAKPLENFKRESI